VRSCEEFSGQRLRLIRLIKGVRVLTAYVEKVILG
jgi:hypothetical protein